LVKLPQDARFLKNIYD
jgi:hypothetical protein